MAGQYGQGTTYTSPDSNLRINIEKQINSYPDWQFPILKRWNSSIFKAQIVSNKYEWSERDLRPVKSTLAGDVTSTATTLSVADPGVFNVDDVIRFPNGSTAIITDVTGGINITFKMWTGTQAAMTLTNVVQRIGVASPEGKDADDMVISGVADLYNYTQIFEDVIHLSGSERYCLIHGNEGSADLIERKQKELAEILQLSLLVGVRNRDVADKRSTVGGIKYFIDTYAPANAIDFGGLTNWNTDSVALGKIEDAVQAIADKMGGKPTVYVGYKAMRKIRNLQQSTVRTTLSEKARGIGVVDKFSSQLGDLDIVQIRERAGVLDNLIFFVDEENVGYKAYNNRAWFTEELAKVGDSYKWQVLGEYTAKFALPKTMSYIYNLGL